MFKEDIPPSRPSICPVIQLLLSVSKKAANCATSSVVPILFKGCLKEAFSFLASLFQNLFASGVSVMEGAITFTRTFGAHSAAKDRANPSSAPFDAATLA